MLKKEGEMDYNQKIEEALSIIWEEREKKI